MGGKKRKGTAQQRSPGRPKRSKAKKKSKKATKQRSPGRPKGSKTEEADQEVVFLSRCKKCMSTRRTPFRNSRIHPFTGIDPAGKPATHIVYHLTNCSDCGQLRKVREYLCEPTAAQLEDIYKARKDSDGSGVAGTPSS